MTQDKLIDLLYVALDAAAAELRDLREDAYDCCRVGHDVPIASDRVELKRIDRLILQCEHALEEADACE